MRNYRVVLIIGIIEILIGIVTISTNVVMLALSANTKTPGVLFFVIIAGMTSTLIGIGMLKFKKPAYQLLLYFSSVIILSKILIWLGVLQLNGALEVTLPTEFKRSVSLIYHIFVIYYLLRPDIKKLFHE